MPNCAWIDTSTLLLLPSFFKTLSNTLPLALWIICRLNANYRHQNAHAETQEPLLSSLLPVHPWIRHALAGSAAAALAQCVYTSYQVFSIHLNARFLWMDALGWMLWMAMRWFDYRHGAMHPSMMKHVHLASTWVARISWILLLWQGYHLWSWSRLTEPCSWDTYPVHTLTWVFFGLKSSSLFIFSISLIPQSRLLHASQYDALPNDQRYKPPSSFSEFSMHFSKLIPFIWPRGKDSLKLQTLMGVSFVMMILGRFVNLLVPIQYKRVVDALGGLPINSVSAFLNVANVDLLPWNEILLFVALRFLAGSSGLLQSLQSFFWIPVGQYTTREISVQMLRHLHKFHLNRKTGEILRVQDRGVASIVSLLSSILFNILPTLADIVIACCFFTLQFDILFGSLVLVTMISYMVCTIFITEWRTKYRKRANELDNAMEAKAVDSLLNFETVKYYNAEEFEVNQYEEAVKMYQAADLFSSITLWVLDGAQNITIQLGLLAGCLLCAHRIMVDKTMTVGDFVLYLSYLTQLYGPLNWFGNYYRVIQKNFVDMEKMLDLFKEPQEVNDAPDAIDLVVSKGHIVFDHISFAYDPRKQTLNDVSFEILPGTITAFVGPSGGGKTTLGRLLFRFYDVQEGSIRIDGQDIRHVTQYSLRKSIGVVPQDTVLFNETIRYNIIYAKPGATEEDFLEASQSAQIHDKIQTFPDTYKTQVGERGLRLSGGEKQRVAIARTLLKDPPILLLDEATSALDTHSEAALQQALLDKSRTTMVIAHRLSTIVNADQIIVLKDGKIVEKGRHEDLIKMKREYYAMWIKQLKDENGIIRSPS